jgi:hypothetical protein
VFLRYDPRYGRDEIAQWALTEMDRADGQIPVAQWIWHLCGESSLRVADRLAQTGAIEYVKSGLLGGSRRAVPANANVSATPRVADAAPARHRPGRRRHADPRRARVAIDLDTVIARDAVAPGLRNDLVFAAKEYLHQHLRDVANAVRAAATQANMTIRR